VFSKESTLIQRVASQIIVKPLLFLQHVCFLCKSHMSFTQLVSIWV